MDIAKIKKKISTVQVIRRLIQTAAFIFMPGLFISAFMSLKIVYTAIISGTYGQSSHILPTMILFAVIPATAIMGRFFCGYLCAFGTLGDFLHFLSKKIIKRPLKIGERADKILKSIKYIWLLFIILFVWTLGAVSFNADWNPWNIFGMYTSLSGWSSLSGFITIGGLLLVIIIVGSFLVERFFCRYMCPLGAFFSIISRLRVFRIKKPTDACRSCKLCTKNCPMGIDMYKHDVIKSSECIDCFECVAPCPKENAKACFAGKKSSPIVAAVAVCAAVTLLYFSGTELQKSVYAEPVTAVYETVENQESGPYTDGVYTGSAHGYRGTTEVEVSIENGYITSVNVISTEDDMQFFIPAENDVIPSVLNSQMTNVDAVAGATYSSYAILDAVDDALSGCITNMADTSGIDTTTRIERETQSAQTDALTQEELDAIEQNAAIASLADGTYTGTGSGYRGETTVEVIISSGKISSVKVISSGDDKPYLDSAQGVISGVIELQDADGVDTVSGATFTSNGILEAVANALGLDFENPNSALPQKHGGGRGRGGGH